ncbi:MAG: HlyC/CorC family transporter [Hyphomicrobiaceae bacterium]
MTIEIVIYIAAVFILLALSAFFSGSETALTAASKARMHALEQEGRADAGLVNQILARPDKMIGTVLLGNNLVNILASSLTTSLLIGIFGEFGVAYATIVMTLLIVIFSEVLPKTYALADADRSALFLARPMHWIIGLLSPFTAALAFIVSLLLKLTPSRADDSANILARQEELRGTIELSHKEGAVGREDKDMLGGILDLSELHVIDIMVHRTKMETVNADDPPHRIVNHVVKSQYTRVPVWKDEPDNIVGILHTKDMLSALAAVDWDAGRLDIMSFISPPWFVPDQTGLKDQLDAFLKRKAQLALVVDEYGEVQGLITLEDILEEIVGQITDEHDVHDAAIRAQADGSVLVDGAVAVRDLNRHMDWSLPDDEATSVAGLVIHEAQNIPEPGQAFTFYGYRFEILRKSRNKITALRIRPISAPRRAPSTPANGGQTKG